MNAEQKKKLRIDIAKDVLARLCKKKSIVPTNNTYVWVDSGVQDEFYQDENKEDTEQARQHIDKLTEKCKVCALGALFVGYVAIKNKVMVYEFFDSDSICSVENKLKNAFSKSQMELIEAAFEGRYVNDLHSEKPIDNIFAFYKTYRSPRQRMTVIMQNIIDNDGTLVLPKVEVAK